MKIRNLFLALLVVGFLAACDSKPAETTVASEGNEASSENSNNQPKTEVSGEFNINSDVSHIHWTAEKVLSAGHHGNITISAGSVKVSNGGIESGNFTMDMNSLVVLDEGMDEGSKGKLTSHLMGTAGAKSADDFFNVTAHPTSNFVITGVKKGTSTSHIISGDLTIKAVTHSIEIPCDVEISENQIKATGSVSIDRTKWGITYNSKGFFENVADDYAIKDQVKLEIQVEATK